MSTQAPTRRNKEQHLLTLNADGGVAALNLFSDAYSGGLRTALGLSAPTPEIPATISVLARNREDAMRNGAVPIRLVYLRGRFPQSTGVLCSPRTADTVFRAARGNAYRGFNIIDVRPIRRRVFTVG